MSNFSKSASQFASPSQWNNANNNNSTASSNWLVATTGVAAIQPLDETDVPQPEKPREKTRQEKFQEYMEAYAKGEVNRDRGRALEQGQAQTVEREHHTADADMANPHAYEDPYATTLPQQSPSPFTLTPEQQASYHYFLTTSHRRRLQRHDLATRDKIWSESIARTQARLEAVTAEKAALEAKLVQMRRERERYKAVNVVAVDEVEDQREERKWEEWLRVQRGLVVGVAKEREGEEDDEGGVDV